MHFCEPVPTTSGCRLHKMSYLQTSVITHSQRVCRLYKKGLRLLEGYYHGRDTFRYQAVLLRARFDEHSNEIDMRKAKVLLEAGEEECWEKQHFQPKYFPKSPGGVCYERVGPSPDYVMDLWHPLEKAAYPYYFARREQRKDEYIKAWEKKYGKPSEDDHH